MNHSQKKPSRRQVLGVLGGAAVGVPILTHTPLWGQAACTVISSPSLTEGPYFVDEDLNRRDIRFDADGSLQPGLPLSLAINVSQLVDCNTVPLPGAYVDIWHCNAAGVYSDVGAQSVDGPYVPSRLSTHRPPWDGTFSHHLSRLVSGSGGSHPCESSDIQWCVGNLRIYESVFHGRSVHRCGVSAESVQHARRSATLATRTTAYITGLQVSLERRATAAPSLCSTCGTRVHG